MRCFTIVVSTILLAACSESPSGPAANPPDPNGEQTPPDGGESNERLDRPVAQTQGGSVVGNVGRPDFPGHEELRGVVVGSDGTLQVQGDDSSLRIARSRRVASLSVDRGVLDSWYAKSPGRWAREATNRLYEVLQDDFDFIVLVAGAQTWHPGIEEAGTSIRVRNDIEGIGLEQFDMGEYYGSPERLEHVVVLAGVDQLRHGPSLRELGHRWGNRFVPTAVANHWGFATVGGLLGGCSPGQLSPLGGGEWQCTLFGAAPWDPAGQPSNSMPYAPLELYLMGLAEADEVPPVSYSFDATWTDESLGRFAGTVTTRTMDQLVAEHGPRVPNVAAAQTEFRTLFVLLEPLGGEDPSLLAQLDLEVLDFAMRGLPIYDLDPHTLNFWMATGGLAALDVGNLDASLL